MIGNIVEAWKAIVAYIRSDKYSPEACVEFRDCYVIGVKRKTDPHGVETGLYAYKVDKGTGKVTYEIPAQMGIKGNPIEYYNPDTFKPLKSK